MAPHYLVWHKHPPWQLHPVWWSIPPLHKCFHPVSHLTCCPAACLAIWLLCLSCQVAHQVDLLDSRVKQEQQSTLRTLQALLNANMASLNTTGGGA